MKNQPFDNMNVNAQHHENEHSTTLLIKILHCLVKLPISNPCNLRFQATNLLKTFSQSLSTPPTDPKMTIIIQILITKTTDK
jgi:hypothetical protein